MPTGKSRVPRKVQTRFNLWRMFLKKNKGKYTREQLVRKFNREYGYGTSTKKKRKPRKRQAPRRGRRRTTNHVKTNHIKRYRGRGYETDEESDYTTESE